MGTEHEAACMAAVIGSGLGRRAQEQTGQVDDLALTKLRPITPSRPSEKLSKLTKTREVRRKLSTTQLAVIVPLIKQYKSCTASIKAANQCDTLLEEFLLELGDFTSVDDKVRAFFKCDDSLVAVLHEAICALHGAIIPSLFPAECPSDVPAKEILMLWGIATPVSNIKTRSFGGAKTALYEKKGLPAATRLDAMMNGATE